jgi:hypothetical protein
MPGSSRSETIAIETALCAPGLDHDLVVAHIARRLLVRPRSHREQRDQHGDRAGHAEDDCQDRPEPGSLPFEIHAQ